MKKILGWHWINAGRTLAHDDRPVIPGEVLTVDPPIKACRRGLHSSARILDALQYAPGPVICRVESWGKIDAEPDKIAAQHRRVLWMLDAERVLWTWLCDVAEDACRDHLVTDERSLAAIQLRREWLAGRTVTDLEWAAAEAAARAAAWAAAWDAAEAAAWAAAGAAARAAARDAAWAAARDAAWVAAAARDAAWDAARAAQNQTLEAAVFAKAKRLGIEVDE